MQIDGWKYYNHAVIPTTAPHEMPDILPITDGSIWKIKGEGTPLLARWTTDFDCNYETNWWYVIKDTPFDMARLKAKRRYEINKGKRFFEVREIDPQKYKESIFAIQKEAYAVYPIKYRPTIEKESFFSSMDYWNQSTVLGAFFRETNELVGYTRLSENEKKCIDFITLKTMPDYEKYSINAALVAGILQKYNDHLANGFYICDGARNINHETAFQDYLEKYFEFRKAYCKLHVQYAPKINLLVKMLFPMRNILLKFEEIKFIHFLNSVLKMEEINREGNI